MRQTRILSVAAIALLCVALATPASARGYHRGGGGGRVVVGVGLGLGIAAATYPYWYYPRPYAYYPYSYPYAYPYYPPVVYSAPPVTYVEQQAAPQQQYPQAYPQAAPAQNAGSYWYYCADSRSYYPYVQQCASAWQQVSPTPPGR